MGKHECGAKIKTVETRDRKHIIDENCSIPVRFHGLDPVLVDIKKLK